MNSQKEVPPRFQAALARLEGHVELLRSLAVITIEDLPEVIKQVDAAVDRGECQQAANDLHKLKGMLSTFESDGVAIEIGDMMELARQQQSAALTAAWESQRAAIAELTAQITGLAESLES